MNPVRIFIGSGDASLLERQTLIHSLHTHSGAPLDIAVVNGTTSTIERGGHLVPAAAALAKLQPGRFVTEFSLFRYIIPQLCGFEGRAIYLDSDIVCLADIGELFHTALDGCDLAARPNAYPEIGPSRWATSVMVIDCARTCFDLDAILEEIRRDQYTYTELSQLAPRFLARHPYRIRPIAPAWNTFDFQNAETKLVHYTDLDTQPWRYPYHPHGDVWFRYFHEATERGLVTVGDCFEEVVAYGVRLRVR